MYGFFEADRFVRCPSCGENRLAIIPGTGLFEAEVRWLGPECAVDGDEARYGIVALTGRPHRCDRLE